MAVLIALVVVACGAAIFFKIRQRAKARAAAREKYGKPCPSCGKYVHPAAAICKHCYARLPTPKA
ncbi:hypothetical protein [Pigmentiphaga sp.]|jgi:Predicted nucleic-acid-binding protein containing a Zn-ribbon|uniref:hypothetical protein n=1 Tax=Pigmentiphaga sp. TaxID=1977564 RepID=UPI0025E927C1|nr:hypothetical protein [Pigmentiphaga sp.]MBX6319193.1 hypothetical protein [Pigmentiphaga sp.]